MRIDDFSRSIDELAAASKPDGRPQDKVRINLGFMPEEVSSVLKPLINGRMQEDIAFDLAKFQGTISLDVDEGDHNPVILVISRGDINDELFEQNLNCYGADGWCFSASTTDQELDEKALCGYNTAAEVAKNIRDTLASHDLDFFKVDGNKYKMANFFKDGEPNISVGQIGFGEITHVCIQFPEMGLQSSLAPLYAMATMKAVADAGVFSDKQLNISSYGAGGSTHEKLNPGDEDSFRGVISVRMNIDPQYQLNHLINLVKRLLQDESYIDEKIELERILNNLENILKNFTDQNMNHVQIEMINKIGEQRMALEALGVSKNKLSRTYARVQNLEDVFAELSAKLVNVNEQAKENLVAIAKIIEEIQAGYAYSEVNEKTTKELLDKAMHLIKETLQTNNLEFTRELYLKLSGAKQYFSEVTYTEVCRGTSVLYRSPLSESKDKAQEMSRLMFFHMAGLNDDQMELSPAFVNHLRNKKGGDYNLELDSLIQELNSLDQARKDLTEQLASMQAAYANLEANLFQDRMSLSRNQRKLEVLQSKLDQAQSDLENVNSKRDQVISDLARMRDMINQGLFAEATDGHIFDPALTTANLRKISKENVEEQIQIATKYLEREFGDFLEEESKKPNFNIAFAASLFIGEPLKKAVRKLSDGRVNAVADCNMEDDVVAGVVNGFISKNLGENLQPKFITMSRVHCDPFEVSHENEAAFKKWTKETRTSLDRYVDAVLWGLTGFQSSALGDLSRWELQDHVTQDGEQKLFFAFEDLHVVDPFWREWGTDLLADIAEGKAFRTDIDLDVSDQTKADFKQRVEDIKALNAKALVAYDAAEKARLAAEVRENVASLIHDFLSLNKMYEADGSAKIWVRKFSWAGNKEQTLDGITFSGASIDRAFYVSSNVIALIDAERKVELQKEIIANAHNKIHKYAHEFESLNSKTNSGPKRRRSGVFDRMPQLQYRITSFLRKLIAANYSIQVESPEFDAACLNAQELLVGKSEFNCKELIEQAKKILSFYEAKIGTDLALAIVPYVEGSEDSDDFASSLRY